MENQEKETSSHGQEERKIPSAKPVVLALLAVFLIFAGLIYMGMPQKWSELKLQEMTSHATHEEASAPALPALPATDANKADAAKPADVAKAPETAHAAHAQEAGETKVPPMVMIIPFCLLLLCIAILPLIPFTEHWWESNLHRFFVAAGLGIITLAYYAFSCDFPIAVHWPAHSVVTPDQGALAMGWGVFINAIVDEYIPFIVLLFALFTIAGGIRISGDLKASPLVNTIIIGLSSMLASFVGTTAAAMLLIRLLLETNKERKHKVHTIVFFIFCACNCGGCLLPIGDPPLFLGYLKGVNFLWTFDLWREWLFVNGILLAVYFLWDACWYYPREEKSDKAQDAKERVPLKIGGLWPNLFCLIGVVLAVMFLAPGKPLQIGSFTFNPWMFLREIVQLLLVAISLICGSKALREANNFNYAAILEVAALVFGIFICMQAPLQILDARGEMISKKANDVGGKIGLTQPQQFFWMTGSLSSVLDNAPTYVVFFETARAAEAASLKSLEKEGKTEEAAKLSAELKEAKEKAGVPIPLHLLAAVSLGAVFMGAMTYIGNGPNFMVKAIAEQAGVKMPSFFGYMVYSVLLLLPIMIAMTMIFLK